MDASLFQACDVAILCGGRSGEHEVSLVSAQGVYAGLAATPLSALLLAMDKQGGWHLGSPQTLLEHRADPAKICIRPRGQPVRPVACEGLLHLLGADGAVAARARVCFPLIHGSEGEDGVLQGWLQLQQLPYVGAGVLGSAVGMDKDVMKRLLAQAGLPSAPHVVLRSAGQADFAALQARLGLPLFVKPASLGSSVGVSRIDSAPQLQDALSLAFSYDDKVLIEQAISGRELECSVLGAPASPTHPPQVSVFGEIRPAAGGFYSYQAKYLEAQGAELCIPASLSPAQAARGQELALRVFEVLECTGLARVDFFLQADGEWIVNEINTLPGFTPISMYPKLWEAAGLPYPQLLQILIQLALERSQRQQRLRRDFF